MKVRTVVVGAGGYSGAELVGLLLAHPSVEIAGLFGSDRSTSAPFAALFPRFRGRTDLVVEPSDPARIEDLRADAVFLATPHEASHDLAPALLEAGLVAIDLSGAFRLPDPALYPAHYGFTHERPDLLASAVYGLPELNRDALPGAALVAVPGCYPTSAVLPLRPLADAGALDPRRPVIVDSASGASGAGRAPSHRTHFCEVSYQAYGVLDHRHAPEIRAHGGAEVIFTPHLGPWDRGILSTIHIPLAPGVTEPRVRRILQDAYGDEPFVRLLPAAHWPSVGAVRFTNYCDIALRADEKARHLIVVSALDNLLKGAAGQAVQCLNARFGLPETEGLLPEVPCAAR